MIGKANYLSLASAVVVVGCALQLSLMPKVQAADLTERSIQVSSSRPSIVTTHTVRFNIPTINNIGSLVFEYCDNSPLFDQPCNPPAGLNVANANLTSQSGEIGFTVHGNSTANRLVLGRPAGLTIPGTSEYALSNITNPSTPSQTIYVKLSTRASSDGTGADVDKGAVAFSTSGDVGVTAFVPPYLVFCSGVNVGLNCTSANGFYLNLGNLSPTTAKTATSQLAAHTNDENGYVITTQGTTMTSGNNTIDTLSSQQPSLAGNPQFGINLRANSNPPVGQDVFGSGTATPTADYDDSNLFKYVSTETIASSSLPTESNVFTVSYVVNIPHNQAPGVYTTTLTYICTATF